MDNELNASHRAEPLIQVPQSIKLRLHFQDLIVRLSVIKWGRRKVVKDWRNVSTIEALKRTILCSEPTKCLAISKLWLLVNLYPFWHSPNYGFLVWNVHDIDSRQPDQLKLWTGCCGVGTPPLASIKAIKIRNTCIRVQRQRVHGPGNYSERHTNSKWTTFS